MENSILILAVGGGAGNIVKSIVGQNKKNPLSNVRYMIADTDDMALEMHKSWGKYNIELLKLDMTGDEFPSEVFQGVKHLFVVVALGGYTGSNFSVYAVQKAKEMDIASISVIATIPFDFEENRKYAYEVLSQLKDMCPNSLFFNDNAKLKERYSKLNFMDAFEYADLEVNNIICRLINTLK